MIKSWGDGEGNSHLSKLWKGTPTFVQTLEGDTHICPNSGRGHPHLTKLWKGTPTFVQTMEGDTHI